MKKTVTTILSLALAIIMVSSLSSGVILAKGPSDNASDQGKERARFQTERDVAILRCVNLPIMELMFDGFEGPADIMLPADDMAPDFGCVANLAFLVNKGFKIEGVMITPVIVAGVVVTRYTVVRTRRVRRED